MTLKAAPEGATTAPADEEAVQYIVDYSGIHSGTAIANTLNDWGIRDPRGRKWNNQRVREVAEANAHITSRWAKTPAPTKNPLAALWAEIEANDAFLPPYNEKGST